MVVVVALAATLPLSCRTDEAGETDPAAQLPEAPATSALALQGPRTAVARGLVSSRGEQPRSYKEITLRLRNLTGERIVIDLCGSYLTPKKRGSCQRLGIGPPTTPGRTKRRGPGTLLVDLEPRMEEKLRMNTVCLDAGRASPGQQEFDVAREPLPEVRETVLRWWADNPTAPPPLS